MSDDERDEVELLTTSTSETAEPEYYADQPRTLGSAPPSQIKRYRVSVVLMGVTIFALFIAVIVLATKKSDDSTPQLPETAHGSVLPAHVEDGIYDKIDSSANPCHNFYKYACGKWYDEFTLPDGAGSYTIAFSENAELVLKEQKQILTEKFPFIGSFYAECTDMDAIEALGTTPLQPWLNEINTVTQDLPSFFRTLGRLHRTGLAMNALMSTSVQGDFKLGATAPQRFYIEPSGTTLPSPDYYNFTANPKELKSVRSSIEAVHKLLGFSQSDAERAAQAVLELEAVLVAAVPYERVQSIDDYVNEMKIFSVDELDNHTGMRLKDYFPQRSDTPVDTVDVLMWDFFVNATSLLQTQSTFALQSYLRWHMLYDGFISVYLPESFRQIFGALYSEGLRGLRMGAVPARMLVQQNKPGLAATNTQPSLVNSRFGTEIPTTNAVFSIPFESARQKSLELSDDPDKKKVARESLCLSLTLDKFADFFSHQWVIQDFPPEKLAWATTLVTLIYNQIGKRLDSVSWLDDKTRQAAKVKWDHIVKNVGYSSEWIEYVDLSLQGDLFADMLSVTEFKHEYTMETNYGKPVNRHVMPTRNYMIQNAFYDPLVNNINLLAGLMYPPMFGVDLPLMLNLAGYGMVIGHEITHGFDNTGRLFNGTGAFVNWWTPTAEANFDLNAQCLVDQYNQFKVFGFSVNGQQTLGENIADGGGIRAAFNAYQAAVADGSATKDQITSRLSNDQLFFTWYAQGWCTKQTPLAALFQLLYDPHSPSEWRVNGPLSNFKPFADAFNCPSDSPMGRSLTSNVCEVW